MRWLFFFLPLFIEAAPLGVVNRSPTQDGRTGDQLMMYIKGRWIAKQRGLPFYFVPFRGAEEFILSDIEMAIPEEAPYIAFPYAEHMLHPKQLDMSRDGHYYFATTYDGDEVLFWEEMRRDAAFMQELRERISPKEKIEPLPLPKDRWTVAMHIRKGGGFDRLCLSMQYYTPSDHQYTKRHHRRLKGFSDGYHPFKFLPNQYYVDCLQQLSKMLGHPPLHVYLFTDDPYPGELAKEIAAHAHLPSATFDYRKEENHHSLNVLADLFHMAEFDCVIRSRSHYPQIATLLYTPKITFFPLETEWYWMWLVATKVGVYVRDTSVTLEESGVNSSYHYFFER